MQEDTAEYGAKDDADAKGMQRVVDELMDKVRLRRVLLSQTSCCHDSLHVLTVVSPTVYQYCMHHRMCVAVQY